MDMDERIYGEEEAKSMQNFRNELKEIGNKYVNQLDEDKDPSGCYMYQRKNGKISFTILEKEIPAKFKEDLMSCFRKYFSH